MDKVLNKAIENNVELKNNIFSMFGIKPSSTKYGDKIYAAMDYYVNTVTTLFKEPDINKWPTPLLKEYSKINCIGFTEWVCGGHGDIYTVYSYSGKGMWDIFTPSLLPKPIPKVTTEELYNLFLKDTQTT